VPSGQRTDVEVGADARLVARGRDIEKSLRGGNGLLLPFDLLGKYTNRGDVVFYLLEGGVASMKY
jgi:hypothetical protein